MDYFNSRLDGVKPYHEAKGLAQIFGTKGGLLTCLPTAWTPSFICCSPIDAAVPSARNLSSIFSTDVVEAIESLGEEYGQLIVRSSVLGETVWERGKYHSQVVRYSNEKDKLDQDVLRAIGSVIKSAPGRTTGLLFQGFVAPSMQGEFGNLLRVSKTRDHWELSTKGADGGHFHRRLNAQRDPAADQQRPLRQTVGRGTSRLFGSIAAWLNNELLVGVSQRSTCEWISDAEGRIFLVQIDVEDEDVHGRNPFQIRVPWAFSPRGVKGHFLRAAEDADIGRWDKLAVLDELWSPGDVKRPVLFMIAENELPKDTAGKEALASEIASFVGPDGIVVRTSGRRGSAKIVNLPRTECLTPPRAVEWMEDQTGSQAEAGPERGERAFILHRFIAARASAWVRAAPGDSHVSIHALWGLPDALQFFPYDIWDVHLSASVATCYPEYKSNVLLPQEDGSWRYVRVKNEIARAQCIGRKEALDLALRSAEISRRLGRACHIMWFIGCRSSDGSEYSIPWYWTEAHDQSKNPDRFDLNEYPVRCRSDLETLKRTRPATARLAIRLQPTDLNLMRDKKFIAEVADYALESNVPIVLLGSTLAHAFYLLRDRGCAVLTPSERQHTRVRQLTSFSKLVRDKIPEKIADRQEMDLSKPLSGKLLVPFLIAKLFEESLEVRGASSDTELRAELADLYEVLISLVKACGLTIPEIELEAQLKREKAGGFDKGLVLLKTGVGIGLGQNTLTEDDGQSMIHRGEAEVVEIPLSSLVSSKVGASHSAIFYGGRTIVEIRLKSDRLSLEIVSIEDQPLLPGFEDAD